MSEQQKPWRAARLIHDPRGLGREGMTFWVRPMPPNLKPRILADDGALVEVENGSRLTTNLFRYTGEEHGRLPLSVQVSDVELLDEYADDMEVQFEIMDPLPERS